MNWKIIVGGFFIFGAIKGMTSALINYYSGKLSLWPYGSAVGFILLISAGIYLFRQGRKMQK